MLRLALDLLTRSKASLQTHNHNPTHRSKSSAHFCLRTYMRPKHITGNDVPKIVYDLTPGITTYCILQKNVLGFLLQRLREEWNRSKSNFSWNDISRSTSILDNHDNEHSKFQHISCCPMSQGNHPEMELPVPEKCAALTCRGAGWYPQAKPVLLRFRSRCYLMVRFAKGMGLIQWPIMSGTEKNEGTYHIQGLCKGISHWFPLIAGGLSIFCHILGCPNVPLKCDVPILERLAQWTHRDPSHPPGLHTRHPRSCPAQWGALGRWELSRIMHPT